MKKSLEFFSLLFLIITLTSCASTPKICNPLTNLEQRASTNHDFTIGLALAGGGTKAANFSMGVLQGLSETEVIDRVDAISSVSGGGYAALWFYSKLLNDESQKPSINERIAPFFKDCLQSKYSCLANKSSIDSICKNDHTFYSPQDHSDSNPDPYRYQNYIRGYQDIFSSGSDKLGNTAFSMEVTGEKQRLKNDIGQLAVKTLGASVINFIPNIVFDWELPLSPSRAAYEKGILRTFGAEVPACKENECEKFRPEGSVDSLEKLTFKRLRQAYEGKDENENESKYQKVPLWIINTTAGENRELFNFGEASPLMLTSYEMTPYGAGSGLYGYCSFNDEEGCTKPNEKLKYKEMLPEVEKVTKAVIMSAAFFDEQQRSLGSRLNGITKPLQSLSTLNWGISRENPRVIQAKKIVHKVLPWPFYYWHGYNGADSVNIRFSDGGQSENLGAYALIRRQVTDIIISDHSQDRDGRMADICNLKNNLAKLEDPHHLYLYIPGLKDLNKVCEGKTSMGYAIFDWKHPILLGCVSKSSNDVDCSDEKNLMSRLYIIKPAIPKERNAYTKLGEFLPFPLDNQKRNCVYLQANTKYDTPKDSASWQFEDKVSCELVGYWANNVQIGSVGINKKDNLPHFPQFSTAGLTLNSSNTIYGASRELARYYARQLAWFFDKNMSLEDVKSGFNKVIEYQQNNCMVARDI